MSEYRHLAAEGGRGYCAGYGVARRIAALRSAGLSMNEIARRAGLDRTTVNRIGRGQTLVHIGTHRAVFGVVA
jgi:hypothetical protein